MFDSGTLSVFRFRLVLQVLIYGVGLFVPWGRVVPAASSLSTWLVLAAAVARQEWMSFTDATVVVLVVAIVLACAAAALRTWAAAWMGHAVVSGGEVQAKTLVAEGPYRRMRHPLYVGILLHTAALAILMPPAGAVFALAATVLLDAWLMRSEDRSLRERLGSAYAAYRGEVPAVLPRIRARASVGGRPAWGFAVFSEVYFWAVAASFLALGWRYNAFLLQRCVLVSFGLGLVVRALLPKQTPAG